MQVAARTGAWAKSGYTAKDYVQDGLVAMWDGIENAGWGVHDPNATAWKDLSGKAVDLIVNSGTSWTGVGLTSDDVSPFAYFNGLPLSQDRRTIEVCMKTSPVNGWSVPFMYNASYDGTCVMINSDGGENLWIMLNPVNTPAISLAVGECTVSFVGNKPLQSASHAYANGISRRDRAPTVTGAYTGSLSIGGQDISSKPAYGFEIYNVRLYDVDLSPDQIAKNYDVDKARFGLP